MTEPTLSVLMPNYNHASFIRLSLEAILSQSFPPKEVIVVDDASTDNSVEVIEEIARKQPIVRLLRNDRNRGCVWTINRAFREASGDYVYSISSDDVVQPGFFEKALALLRAYPQAGLCCCHPSMLDGVTREIHPNRVGWSDQPTYLSPAQLARVIRPSECIWGHTTIMKRSAWAEAGGMLPETRWHCDWFADLVVAFRHGICFLPESLALYRTNPQSYSATGMRNRIEQLEVLGHLLRLLCSPAYRDVLPFFQMACVQTVFGPNIVRAAARRSAKWDVDVLFLAGQLSPREYETLLDDSSAGAAEMAAFFLSRRWSEIRSRVLEIMNRDAERRSSPLRSAAEVLGGLRAA